ncbi:hypothetical protein OsI_00682 [Oryza sativa Indica Group]|uniref:Uncharacterized protein n=4 Tax=Oryza TaxID=4527 RepID=A0A0D3EKF6_9ORYZ|nr:uncharacterized protein LOC127760388 [Oryza glaberrima]EAY72815.1 hypothetical protein OsI_00682 [Oryza sativa Indica Group]
MADDVAASPDESLTAPLLEPAASPRDGPSVEVRLYRRGAGPVAVFRSALVGPRRDRLQVRAIQAEHGLRALFAFKPESSLRGLRIRSGPAAAAGCSAVPFRDGAVIALDGEPKGSWTKPAAVIVAGVLVPAVMVAVAVKGVPEPLRSSRVVNAVFPPWILASAVIIYARVRTRPRAAAP